MKSTDKEGGGKRVEVLQGGTFGLKTEKTLLGVGSELSDGSSSGPDLRVVNDVELLRKGRGKRQRRTQTTKSAHQKSKCELEVS